MTPAVAGIDASVQSTLDVAQFTHTDTDTGLTSAEAAKRLAAHGPNALTSRAPTPWWRLALSQFADPLVYLLLAAFVVTLAAWLVEGREGAPYDSIVIGVVVIANAAIGLAQERKSASAVAALQSMSAATSLVLRDGKRVTVPAADLVVGDILLLAEGDSVGADARLFESQLHVAEASLTGESVPVAKTVDPLDAPAEVGDRSNMVFAGTAVTRGTGAAIVTAIGMDTETGRIAHLLGDTESDPTPLQREIGRLGRSLGIGVMVIAAVVVATVWLTSDVSGLADAVEVLLLGVALAVAAVPEGLPAVLSVVLSLGVRRMAARNAIVRDLSSVEALGSASVICTDKTGTLTLNRMTLTTLVTASGRVEVTADGPADAGIGPEAEALLLGGCLANDALASGDAERIDGDPTDAAFLAAERDLGLREGRVGSVTTSGTVPFSAERARMSALAVGADGATVLHVKGGPEAVLDLCTHELCTPKGAGGEEGRLEPVPLTAPRRAELAASAVELAAQGMRTLAVAQRAVDAGVAADPELEKGLAWVGLAGLVDPPRPEAKAAVADAHGAGIRVVMITGDHPATALAIATELGIASLEDTAITGAQLAAMSPEELREAVASTTVFARVSPEMKLRLVDAFQAGGETVSMTGDGVNDAPALRSANIGVAMGKEGTEVAREASNMILADDNFATIVMAVREGRGVLDNIKRFLRYMLASNFGEVLAIFIGVAGASWFGLTGHGEAIAIPLLATQILWINLLTDLGPALAISAEPYADDLMDRPPRAAKASLIDARMWRGIAFTGAAMAAVTLVTFDLLLPSGFFDGTEELDTARTAAFTVLVLAHLTNAFSARSETASIVHRWRSNPLLWGAVAASALMQVAVVHVPALNEAFSTAPLTAAQWFMCVGLAMFVPLAIEARKAVLRFRDARRSTAQ